MSIFKKPEKGLLAKLFKLGQVEELAEELAHTDADEMQEELQSESDEPTAAEDTAAESVPMLEVTESGGVDLTGPTENAEGGSPPPDTEPSEVRKHLMAAAFGVILAISCKSCSIHSIGCNLKVTSRYMVQDLHLLWVQPCVICNSGNVSQLGSR